MKKYRYNLLLFLEKMCSMNELDSDIEKYVYVFVFFAPTLISNAIRKQHCFFINKCGGKCSELHGQSLECLKV